MAEKIEIPFYPTGCRHFLDLSMKWGGLWGAFLTGVKENKLVNLFDKFISKKYKKSV